MKEEGLKLIKYKINIQNNDDVFVISMPCMPEFNAIACRQVDIQKEAFDAFELSLDFYTETKRPIPLPTECQECNHALVIPEIMAAKIYLYNEWLASNTTKIQLATRIGTKPSNLDRLFDFRYRSEMEAIELALAGLGKSLEVKVT